MLRAQLAAAQQENVALRQEVARSQGVFANRGMNLVDELVDGLRACVGRAAGGDPNARGLLHALGEHLEAVRTLHSAPSIIRPGSGPNGRV